MTTCPKCRSRDFREHKSWEVKPRGNRGIPMRVTVYSCRSCGNKFRKATNLSHVHHEHSIEPQVSPGDFGRLQPEAVMAPVEHATVESESPPMQSLSAAAVETASSPVDDGTLSSPGNGHSDGWFHRFKLMFRSIF